MTETIRCTAGDIHGHEPLDRCERCGLRQPESHHGHVCCTRCGWCVFGEEYGCPECLERSAG